MSDSKRKRTPRQRAISAAATGRAIREARERHIRLYNERVLEQEQAYAQRIVNDFLRSVQS